MNSKWTFFSGTTVLPAPASSKDPRAIVGNFDFPEYEKFKCLGKVLSTAFLSYHVPRISHWLVTESYAYTPLHTTSTIALTTTGNCCTGTGGGVVGEHGVPMLLATIRPADLFCSKSSFRFASFSSNSNARNLFCALANICCISMHLQVGSYWQPCRLSPHPCPPFAYPPDTPPQGLLPIHWG